MFKQRTVLLIGTSGLLALGAAWVANNWALNQNELVEELKATDTTIVVASMNIPYGQKLDEKHIKLLTVPKEMAPASAYKTTDEVMGKVAKSEHIAGDILRQERFAEHLEGSTLASMIETNKRAITVRVNDVIGVAGFLLPGNRVDVLATKQIQGRGLVQTETILKDIKVLAVDQTAATEKNEPVIVRAVTLEMKPNQAEVLVKARDEGSIQLALRNPLEKNIPKPEPVAEPVKKPQRVARYVPGPRKITVIRGTKVSVVKR